MKSNKDSFIKTLSIFQDLNSAAIFNVQVNTLPTDCEYVVVNTISTSEPPAVAPAILNKIYLLWCSIPTADPTGIISMFRPNESQNPMTILKLSNPGALANINFKLYENGIGSGVQTVTDGYLAIQLSFFRDYPYN